MTDVFLPEAADELAPDGSEVRRLCRTDEASMAHFTFPAGTVGHAVVHQRVSELWYILSGRGEIWRAPPGSGAETLSLAPGTSFAIGPGCVFQVRADAGADLQAVAVTLPPWSGDGEARAETGPWIPSAYPALD